MCSKHGYLRTNGDCQEIKSLLGEYHCVFRSTDRLENRINRALLELSQDKDGFCGAIFKIYDDNNRVIKTYKGTFFVNLHFKTCYFILIGERWQEVSLMIAPIYTPTKEDTPSEYMVAQVLTSSSGKKKERTVTHRMLLSRKKMTDKQVRLARSQLMLNTDIIYIRPEYLKKLENEIDEKLRNNPNSVLFKGMKKACKMVREESKSITLMAIEESKIYDAKVGLDGTTNQDRALITAQIRRCSEGIYYNKVSESVEELFEAIIQKEFS